MISFVASRCLVTALSGNWRPVDLCARTRCAAGPVMTQDHRSGSGMPLAQVSVERSPDKSVEPGTVEPGTQTGVR